MMHDAATDMAMVISKRFLRSMAQPFEISQDGISLWGLEDIKAKQAEQAAATQPDGEPMDVDGAGQNGQVGPGPDEDDLFAGLSDQASCVVAVLWPVPDIPLQALLDAQLGA